MAKRSKYTRAQKRAFYSGQGYRAGQKGKKIPFKNKKNLQSFREGYASVRITVEGYPDLDKKKKN